jgi:hypothetical protein
MTQVTIDYVVRKMIMNHWFFLLANCQINGAASAGLPSSTNSLRELYMMIFV